MQVNDRTIRDVTGKLAQMEESNKKIFEVGKDISSLQEILRAPKLRGSLGELFLGELLSQTFPKDQYALQYTFKSGEIVDAIVKLRDGVKVAIDAKFPLESFKRMLEATDDTVKKTAQKEFIRSIKQRVDEICQKYIVPDEGTLDFALMYIPAENVYYEMMVKGEIDYGITDYCYSKRVIPVSPNNLYVYLQTIVLGLRGMQIESRARDILQDLGRLQGDFGKVSDSYEVMGKHLMSAVGRYQDTQKLMSNFSNRVEKIESQTHPQAEVAEDKTESLPEAS
jgi:DNA recombination protein RmuC